MENKKKEIEKFYKQIFSDEKLKERIREKAKKIVTEEDLRKLIREEIMPLMKKFKVNFSEEELLEYEEKSLKELSAEDLEGVSGGKSVKSALITGGVLSLALLGGVGLSASAMKDGPPSSQKNQQQTQNRNKDRQQQTTNNDNVNSNSNNTALAQQDVLKGAVSLQLENSERQNLISESKKSKYMQEKDANGLAVAFGGEGIFGYMVDLSGGVLLTDCYTKNENNTLKVPEKVITQDGQVLLVVGIGGEDFRNATFNTIEINSLTKSFRFEDASFYTNKNIKTVDCSNARSLEYLEIGDSAFAGTNLKSFLAPSHKIKKIITGKNAYVLVKREMDKRFDMLTDNYYVAPIGEYKSYEFYLHGSKPNGSWGSWFKKAPTIIDKSKYVLDKLKNIINFSCWDDDIKEFNRDNMMDDLVKVVDAIENNKLDSLEQSDRDLLLNAYRLLEKEDYDSQINVWSNDDASDNNNNDSSNHDNNNKDNSTNDSSNHDNNNNNNNDSSSRSIDFSDYDTADNDDDNDNESDSSDYNQDTKKIFVANNSNGISAQQPDDELTGTQSKAQTKVDDDSDSQKISVDEFLACDSLSLENKSDANFVANFIKQNPATNFENDRKTAQKIFEKLSNSISEDYMFRNHYCDISSDVSDYIVNLGNIFDGFEGDNENSEKNDSFSNSDDNHNDNKKSNTVSDDDDGDNDAGTKKKLGKKKVIKNRKKKNKKTIINQNVDDDDDDDNDTDDSDNDNLKSSRFTNLSRSAKSKLKKSSSKKTTNDNNQKP